MFRVCLIQPPIEDFYTTSIRNIPLGLLSIGANLTQKHQVCLLDLRHHKPYHIAIPEELKATCVYYRPGDTAPFSLYKFYSRFGTSAEKIRELIPRDTDVFLVTALFSTYIYEALEVINIIKEVNKQVMVIVGGSGAMFHAGEFFDGGADFIIQGEGEHAVIHLLDELTKAQPDLASVPNLLWYKKGNIIRNKVEIIEEIDRLSFPDYGIPGTPEYFLNGKRHAMLITSRGCPHNCKFCSTHQIFGSRYRLRSVENVLTEIADKIDQGFRSFDFEDDHFGGNTAWLNCLLDGIIKKFSRYDLSFQAMNGITVSNLDENVLNKMKQAGFSSVNLSLITPDQSRQAALNRPFKTERFSEIVQIADNIALNIIAYLIIGLPGDSIADNLKSILFLAELPVLIGPSLFYLTPSTPIFDELKIRESIPDSVRCYRSSYFPCDRPDFSRRSAMTLLRICRIVNFLKAARKFHYRSSSYRVEDKTIIIPDKLSGRQSQITVGFALLNILKESGILYGTGKKKEKYYPLIAEDVNQELINLFLESKIFSDFINPSRSGLAGSTYH